MISDEQSYICENCGEEIIVPIDLSAGSRQAYVEDCPVCCSPNKISVQVDPSGRVTMYSCSEQDLN